jgi:chromate transporter
VNDAIAARSGASAPESPSHGVTLREAFWTWMRVAGLSFGGPAGQIAVMHRILVEEKRWISEERFLHALNYCMLLPGPEAQQLATYIGWLMHRTLGGIMAGGLFVLPGAVAIMALSYIYAGWGNVPIVAALFFGLKAAVLAIVVEAVVRIGKRALKNNALMAIAVAAFVGIFFLGVPFPIIIFGAALIGFVGSVLRLSAFEGGGGHGPSKGKEDLAVVDSLLGEEVPAHARPSAVRALKVSGVWLALWLVPVFSLLWALGVGNVFSQVAVFFSKMAMVTFGGAYAVLAYVAQQAVEHYGWLKPGEMLDGLGMAETTPGRCGGVSGPARPHAGAAHHGVAVRGLHGRVSRPRRAVADAGRHAGRAAGDVGDVHALLPVDLPGSSLRREAPRQQGTERGIVGDHGGGGGCDPQPRHLVRHSHGVP